MLELAQSYALQQPGSLKFYLSIMGTAAEVPRDTALGIVHLAEPICAVRCTSALNLAGNKQCSVRRRADLTREL
ncbi:hypothetical protein JCM10295v2_003196 [Rhodotorula toruloides]